MKKKYIDYIDFERVNSLLEEFNQATGFVTAIIDLDGNIISKSGWRQICTEFHRNNPEAALNCMISGTKLASNIKEHEKYIRFAKDFNLDHKRIPSKKHTLGIYHINHVNSLHNNLKQWMAKFRGVSTKYLPNYLHWYKWITSFSAYSGTSGRRFRKHPDTKPEVSGHFAG